MDEVRTIVKEFGKNEQDTGSTEVQIALLTSRMKRLSEHLEGNRKDVHSRLGLIKMVGKRRRLLTYLKSRDESSYRNILAKLSLRK